MADPKDAKEIHLAALYNNIENFKNSIIRRITNFILRRTLSKIEKDDLEEIQERVNLIEVNQQAYFLAHHFSEEKKLTQQELTEKDFNVHKDTMNYTQVKIKELIADIEEKNVRYKNLAIKYPKLFGRITEILKKMQSQLDKFSEQIKKRNQSERPAEIVMVGLSDSYFLARALHGRYRVFSQANEPLTTEDSAGDCYGYVKHWAEKIEKTKQYQFIPRIDRETKQKQNNQSFYRVYEEEKMLTTNNVDNLDIEEMTKFARRIEVEFVYGIRMRFKEGPGHLLGVRRIPGTHEIEFFDPNFGIFVFKSDQEFNLWFIEYLKSYYSSVIEMQLIKINTQPENALASIADIAEEKTLEKAIYFPMVIKNQRTELNEYYLNECYKSLSIIGTYIKSGRSVEECDAVLREKIKEQTIAYQKMIAFKLGIPAQHTAISEQTIEENILKKPVLDAVEERIQEMSDKDPAKSLLEKLKGEIAKNSAAVPLKTLLNHFLSTKDETGKTYFKTLNTSNENQLLLNSLIEDHETSPHCLLLLQQKLLLTMTDLIISHKNEPAYKDFLSTLTSYAKGEFSVDQTLASIINLSSKQKAAPLNIFQKPPQPEDEIVKILKAINLNDPDSLKKSQEKVALIVKYHEGNSASTLNQKSTQKQQ